MRDESAMEVKAALAEALHVDGAFTRAAALWAELADAGYRPEESELKAALSMLAGGDEPGAEVRLARAAAAGVHAAELAYVRAQRAWRAGEFGGALAELERAEREGPVARPANAAAALLAVQGRTREALAKLERALAADPDDGCALANLANLRGAAWGYGRSASALARAARAAIHRAEPFLVHARHAERAGRAEDAADSHAKAVLRVRTMGQIPEHARPPPVTGAVSGRASADGLELELCLSVPADRPPPEMFLLNAGWSRATVAGGAERAGGRLAVSAAAWTREGEARVLRLHLGGSPAPPCVRLDGGSLELGGASCWLPALEDGEPITWSGRVEAPPGYREYLCADTGSYLAVAPGAELELGAEGAPPVRALGAAKMPALRRAALIASRAARVWTELAGECPLGALPPLVAVERGRSTTCYTTSSFIRIARAVLEGDAGLPLIAHETGHAWWGAGVRFARGSEWLSEALAEYSLHLLEDSGLLVAHRARTLAFVEHLAGELPDRALVKLAADPNPAAQLALRVKGGFAIAALRTLLGDEAFVALVRAAVAVGRDRPIDDYTFFALASRLHGASVTWLANQWAYARAGLELSGVSSVERLGDRHVTRVAVRARGALVPAGPLEVAVLDAGGEEVLGEVDVTLGSGQLVLCTQQRPRRVLLDPHHRQYAAREEVLCLEQPVRPQEGAPDGVP